MERKEIFANKFRSVKKNGGQLPCLMSMLSKHDIDYDRVEALLMVEPELIDSIKCSIDGNGLSYEVPEGLHRAIQALDMRAVSVICLALTNEDFSKLSSKLSRRKKEYLKGVRMRFQNASSAFA